MAVGKNDAGFGVIQALVVAGVASVIVLGTAATVVRGQWYSKLANVRAGRDALAQAMRTQISDVALCTGGLSNNSGSAVDALPVNMEVAFTTVAGEAVKSGATLQGNLLSIKGLYIKNLQSANINGPHALPMQTGELILDAQAGDVGIGTTDLKWVSLGTIYVESSGSTIRSCFNTEGPSGSAALACLQLGGTNGLTNASCDTSAFTQAVSDVVQTQTNHELDTNFTPNVMGLTKTNAALAGERTYHIVVGSAGDFTEAGRASQQSGIDGGYQDVGTRTTGAAGREASLFNDLRGQVAQTAGVANQAMSQAGAAGQTASNAVGVANGANAVAANAANGARNVWGTANLANIHAEQSQNLAAAASSYAGSAAANSSWAASTAVAANGVAQSAYGASSTANSLAYGAANSAQQALNYGTSAYGTAGWANSTAQASVATANGANGTANSANGTATWASSTSNSASSLSEAAYYRPANLNSVNNTYYDCSQMSGTACP